MLLGEAPLKVCGFGHVRRGSYSGRGTDVGGAFCFSIASCFRVVVMGVPLFTNNDVPLWCGSLHHQCGRSIWFGLALFLTLLLWG